MVLGFTSSRSALFAAVSFFIHGRPCSSLCFLVGHTSIFITLLDVFGLSFLFVCVAALIASRHNYYLPLVRIFAFLKAFVRPWRFVRAGLKMSPFFLRRASIFLIV